jgi:class 3 adenylate cyclase
MKRILILILLICFNPFSDISAKAQTAQTKKKMKEIINRYYNKNSIDSAVIIANRYENSDSLTSDYEYWYLRGVIYKDYWKKYEKDFRLSNALEKSFQAFITAVRLDVKREEVGSYKKSIKALAATYHLLSESLITSSTETNDYEVARYYFTNYKKLTQAIDPSTIFKDDDIRFYKMYGVHYLDLFMIQLKSAEADKSDTEVDNVFNKYYDKAYSSFKKVLDLDANDIETKGNMMKLEANSANYKVRKLQVQNEKKGQQIDSINIAKKFTELKLIETKQQQALKNKKTEIMLDSLNTETKLTEEQLKEEKLKSEAIAREAEYQRQMQVQKDAVKEEELKKQTVIRNFLAGGIVIVLLFSFVVIRERNRVKKEKARSEELLLNILPVQVANELMTTGVSKAKKYDNVTVLFTDFKDFTAISEKLSPTKLVDEINYCFSEFDNIIHKHNIEKIKTIGDSYMCAGGLPTANITHAHDVVRAALEMRDFVDKYKKEKLAKGEMPFEIRIGIHTGPVVAGIVGIKKFAYDIWGDTVNTASRMESGGEVGKVNISGSTYKLIRDEFKCEFRGKIHVKGKGDTEMYFVEKKIV